MHIYKLYVYIYRTSACNSNKKTKNPLQFSLRVILSKLSTNLQTTLIYGQCCQPVIKL